MRDLGLRGASRPRFKITTMPDESPRCGSLDLVERDFKAERPNQLWVADLTYVATWRGLRVRRLRHRRVFAQASSAGASPARCAATWPSTRWSRQSTSGRPTWTTASSITATAACNTSRSATPSGLAEAGIEPSVGSKGDSYDNALAEIGRSASSRPRSFAGRVPGATSRMSSSPPWNGSGGSTTTASSAPSVTSPRWSMKRSITVAGRLSPSPPDSTHRVSINKKQLPPFAYLQVSVYEEQIELLNRQVKELQQLLQKHLIPDEDVQRLLWIPGVGRLGAFTILLSTTAWSAFPLTPLLSYCRRPWRRDSAGKSGRRRSKRAIAISKPPSATPHSARSSTIPRSRPSTRRRYAARTASSPAPSSPRRSPASPIHPS